MGTSLIIKHCHRGTTVSVAWPTAEYAKTTPPALLVSMDFTSTPPVKNAIAALRCPTARNAPPMENAQLAVLNNSISMLENVSYAALPIITVCSVSLQTNV